MPTTSVARAASAVIMVRPASFGSNPETAASNRFQSSTTAAPELASVAIAEFDNAVATLRRHGIEVRVFEGNRHDALPDEVFANNWISTHADDRIVLYPMLARNRRRERREDMVHWLDGSARGGKARVVDLRALELGDEYLEGTGSLVIDHAREHAYACLSPRTTPGALAAWAAALGMTTQAFTAVDAAGAAIYHTNVMLALGPAIAVVCLAAVKNDGERKALAASLEASGRDVVAISLAQMSEFAANILVLSAVHGPVIALSKRALRAFDAGQRRRLEKHGALAICDITNIEVFGGGSLRCMLTENWLAGAIDR
jgi:hypothetical protein